MKKFAIVGSGWRACFYIRIAKYYADAYQITGVLCRSEEKVQWLQEEYGVRAVLSEEELLADEPDVIVVAVNKASMAAVSRYWREKGFVVLCETPVGMNRQELAEIQKEAPVLQQRLVVAEQYMYYPTYARMIAEVHSGKIGEVVSAAVSLAHEYHGISLIRSFLGVASDAAYRVLANTYELPVTKTRDRYKIYEDGEILKKSRTIAMIEFEDGRIATYDFDSEQYRSPIRHNTVKITGTRGELINENIFYLDKDNHPQQERLFEDIQSVRDGACKAPLSEDERAISHLMEQSYELSQALKHSELLQAEVESQGLLKNSILTWQQDNLQAALADAYFMLLMQESGGQWMESEGIRRNQKESEGIRSDQIE